MNLKLRVHASTCHIFNMVEQKRSSVWRKHCITAMQANKKKLPINSQKFSHEKIKAGLVCKSRVFFSQCFTCQNKSHGRVSHELHIFCHSQVWLPAVSFEPQQDTQKTWIPACPLGRQLSYILLVQGHFLLILVRNLVRGWLSWTLAHWLVL